MSRTTWQVSEEDGKFVLEVMVDSEIRPDRELVWVGKITIGPSGGVSLPRMHLAGVRGDGAAEDERPGVERERVLRDLIMDNTTNSGTVRQIIRKAARKCVEDSKRFEDLQATRAEREERDRLRGEKSLGKLREMVQGGVQEETWTGEKVSA